LGCPHVWGVQAATLGSVQARWWKLYCSFMFNGIIGINQSLITIFYTIQKKPSNTQ